MNHPHQQIIEGKAVVIAGKKVTLTIDHLLDPQDEDEQYTGRYRVTSSDGTVTTIEMNEKATWVEAERGPSEISGIAGKLIEKYSE